MTGYTDFAFLLLPHPHPDCPLPSVLFNLLWSVDGAPLVTPLPGVTQLATLLTSLASTTPLLQNPSIRDTHFRGRALSLSLCKLVYCHGPTWLLCVRSPSPLTKPMSPLGCLMGISNTQRENPFFLLLPPPHTHPVFSPCLERSALLWFLFASLKSRASWGLPKRLWMKKSRQLAKEYTPGVCLTYSKSLSLSQYPELFTSPSNNE